MGQKKVQKKKYKKKNRGSDSNQEITGIILFTSGILASLGLYCTKVVGVFGDFLRGLLTGMFGFTAFILPPIVLVYSVAVIFKRDSVVLKLRSIYAVFLLAVISSIVQAGHFAKGSYTNLDIIRYFIAFYEDGVNLDGGGIVGGVLSTPFMVTFRFTGTIVIFSALAVIDIILLTNISIANFVRNLRSFFSKRAAARAAGKKERKNSDSDVMSSGDELSLEFKPDSKLIDLSIERTSRELKERTGKSSYDNRIDMGGVPAEESRTVQFIMKDIKSDEKLDIVGLEDNAKDTPDAGAKKPKTMKSRKETAPKEKAAGAGTTDITIPEPGGLNYRYPEYELLKENIEGAKNIKQLKNIALEGAIKLEETLKSFGVEAKVINVSRGPAVTRYELQPSMGVKVSKIVNLSDDISLNLAATGVRIEAPIPGKAAIGIEVPNKEINAVLLREVLDTPEFVHFSSKLAFAIGKDISGKTVIADIDKMPHLLIAGATGSGKSVCVNSLIISLLYKASPDEVKLLMIDPKVVELGIYNGIPHLLIPVVTDPKKAAGALNWAVQEMINRYKLFAEKGVRDVKGYNAMIKESGEEQLLPQIVIIIDELADLMMAAPNDVEDAICRLAQMARAAGMHLVIATQRPSVDVITGLIKANIPSRISFMVSSQVDSRTILDMAGAEKLLGRGDMLFYPVGEPKPIRVQGAFVSDKEVERVVEFVKAQGSADYDADIIEEINSEKESSGEEPGDNDELLPQAIELVIDAGQASVSLIQRKFKVGYARAARIVDQMEARGIVGKYEGSKPRQVLITRQQWQETLFAENK